MRIGDEGRLSFTARELGGTAPGTTPALPQTGFARMGQLDIDNRFGYAGYIWDQHLVLARASTTYATARTTRSRAAGCSLIRWH